MSKLARPRGPLPARVYWVRRLSVLAVLLLLVTGVTRLLWPGEPSPPAGQDVAKQAAAQPKTAATVTSTTTPATAPNAGPTTGPTKAAKKKRKKPKAPVLAQPDGPCSPSDLDVTPSVPRPIAGSDIKIVLSLRTRTSAACEWRASARSLTVKLRSGNDDIWSTQQCPKAIPEQDVVVRNTEDTKIEAVWSARRSDEDCSRFTRWAMPGWYFVEAAAFGGEPAEKHFQLVAPVAQVITKTITPEPNPKTDKNKLPKKKRNGNR